MKRKPKLDFVEVLDLALAQLKNKERISIPQFTKMKKGSWLYQLRERRLGQKDRNISFICEIIGP